METDRKKAVWSTIKNQVMAHNYPAAGNMIDFKQQKYI